MAKTRNRKAFLSLAGLAILAAVSMGVESCAELTEYCKNYSQSTDQQECTVFCENNKDFKLLSDRIELIRACQLGQLSYLSAGRVTAPEALLACDRHFKNNLALAKACRSGVTAEDLRSSLSHRDAGSAYDRETGNNR